MRKLVAISTIALGLAALPVTTAHASDTWIVSLKASSTTVNVDQKVTFTGTVKPRAAAAGDKVVLQERFRPGAKWQAQKKTEVNRKGTYSVSASPSQNTRHSYRVVMPATDKHAKGVSRTVKVTVYAWTDLTDLEAVNGSGMNFGPVDINGTTYDSSVYSSWSGTASIEFNLDHQCDKLRSRFGISDDSTTGGQAEVGVLSDGISVYDNAFDVGQSEQKTVALDRPLKIKLLATDTSTAPDTQGYGAFGNAQAHCTR
jgi:NPCBM/NEW2 domain